MANLGDMHINITWDSEPTEEAKNFIRVEVLKVLKDTFEDASWLREFVRTEVHKALAEERMDLSKTLDEVKRWPVSHSK